MATYAAIASACDAVVRLLQLAWRPELFGKASLTFSVYRAQDFFVSPMDTGVSLFLYRVLVHSSSRTPSGAGAQPATLSLDLHFMLTAWAAEAALEQEILGWVMRTLEDTPILTAGLLNSRVPGVFGADETLAVTADQLSNDELFHLFDLLHTDFRPSVPYVARVARIDSAAMGAAPPL